MRNEIRAASLILAVTVLATGCASIYYNVWESLGWEKRDLLRDSVEEVRSEQEDASEHFSSALERIREIYGLDDGDLEKKYDALNREYERSKERANDLSGRIREANRIAKDLFEEWDNEADQISDPALRSRSRQQLLATQNRYSKLSSAMAQSEMSMQPALQELKDQVLFLKHNLNAQAIGSVETELADVERQIDRLIDDLQDAIRRADEFIKDLE